MLKHYEPLPPSKGKDMSVEDLDWSAILKFHYLYGLVNRHVHARLITKECNCNHKDFLNCVRVCVQNLHVQIRYVNSELHFKYVYMK
jgi:hypothetical protein